MAQLDAGARIGPWVVVRTLGKGSFGITYLARHGHPKLAHLLVAIKEFYPADLVSRREDGSIAVTRKAEPQFKLEQQQFLDEAAAIARVNHVNIVVVQDFIVTNGTSYMVMRLAQGPSLLAKVGSKKTGTFKPYDAPALMTAILTRGYAPYEQYTLSEEEFQDEYDDLEAHTVRSLPRQGPATDLYTLWAPSAISR